MRTPLHFVVLVAWVSLPLSLHAQKLPVVSKDSISVHTVERGTMPLKLRAKGSVVSLQPPKVLVTIFPEDIGSCKVGLKATVQVNPPSLITGEVVAASQSKGGRDCEIRLTTAFP